MIRRPPRSTRNNTCFPYTTLFRSPGIDQMLIDSLGLDPGLERTAIGFKGCSAAINAIRLANHIVRSEPSARVLMVNIELCSLHLQETRDLERLLSGLLFGAGCAAAMISRDARGTALRAFRSEERRVGKACVSTGG